MYGTTLNADIRVKLHPSVQGPSWIHGVKCLFASSMDWDVALLQISGEGYEDVIPNLPHVELPTPDVYAFHDLTCGSFCQDNIIISYDRNGNRKLPDMETIPVHAIGFGQFDPATGKLTGFAEDNPEFTYPDNTTGLLPTVTYGLLGRVIRSIKSPHGPVRLQSSTTVHNGSR